MINSLSWNGMSGASTLRSKSKLKSVSVAEPGVVEPVARGRKYSYA